MSEQNKLVRFLKFTVELDFTLIIFYVLSAAISTYGTFNSGYYVSCYFFNVLILNRFLVKVAKWSEAASDILTRSIVLFSAILYAVAQLIFYVDSKLSI